MATAEISQTFYPDGTCESLTMTVTTDIIDAPETIDQTVRQAAVLWHITDDNITSDDDDE